VPGQGAAATSGLSFNGQNARSNNITIDGLDNNDLGSGSVRSTFSQEAVQEFQVISDGYSAEFGRALGGVVNIITKGGGNSYQGTIFLFNRNDNISARNAFASVNPDFEQYQFGSTVSGPIKQDKAFFFTSFERLSLKQSNIVTISDATVAAINRQGFQLRNGPIPFSEDTSTLLARIDLRLSPKDNLYLRYNYGGTYNGAFEPFGGLIGDTSAGIQKLTDNVLSLNNTYLNPQKNLVNETRFLYTRRIQDVVGSDAGPDVSLALPEGNVAFGRNVFIPQARDERITQIVDNVSLGRGRNQIKFGGDFLHFNLPTATLPVFPGGFALFDPIDFSAATGRPGLPAFTGLQTLDPSLRTPAQQSFLTLLANLLPAMFPTFPKGVPLDQLSLPTAYVQGFESSLAKGSINLFGLFVQDDLKLKPNLLLKLGLRYDLTRVSTFPIPNNDGNFSPRIAISYHPNRLPRLNLHGSYGIFFAADPFGGAGVLAQLTGSGGLKIAEVPFPLSVLPFAQPGHHLLEAAEPPSGLFVTQLSLAFQFDKNFRNEYAEQVNTGFDYFIGNNTVISVNYNFDRGLKLFSDRNINPIINPILGNPVLSATTGRPDPTHGDVFQLESSFDSYYNGMTVSINRRLSNHVGFLASYTLSKSIDDFIDFRIDLDEGTAQNPLRPADDRGLSLQDVRNRFVLSGIWDLNYTKNRFLKDFQLSAIANIESGHPYNLLAGVNLSMNGNVITPSDRPRIGGVSLGRNVGILPGFANVDMRLTRTLAIKERYKLQGFLEVFNLFNRVNISTINRIFPPDAEGNFDLPPKAGSRFIATPDRFRSAFDPRQFQLGFRFIF
jgi:hypothetical protein